MPQVRLKQLHQAGATTRQRIAWTGTGWAPVDAGWPFSVVTVDKTDPDADYSTIQAAINGLTSDAVIYIGPGTYSESLSISGSYNISFVGMVPRVGEGMANHPVPEVKVSNISLIGAYLVSVSSDVHISFSNIQFYGSAGSSSTTYGLVNSSQSAGYLLSFRDCFLKGYDGGFSLITAKGILCTNANLILDNVEVESDGDTSSNCIEINNSSSAQISRFRNVLFSPLGGNGIYHATSTATEINLYGSCSVAGLSDTGNLSIVDHGSAFMTGSAASITTEGNRTLKTATFNAEYSNGDSGSSKTVDWNNGQKQMITLTGDCTFTFTDPPGPCNLILRMVQDATGGRDPSWPASVKWVGSAEPTWSSGNGDIDIVSFYFDGTNYYAAAGLNFG